MERTLVVAMTTLLVILSLMVGACAGRQGPAFDIPRTPEALEAKSDCDQSFERCAQLRSRGDGYCNRAWSRCYNGIPGSEPHGGERESF